jgi:prepilin-type N-terminal cleavage/methylation domain-containing protein
MAANAGAPVASRLLLWPHMRPVRHRPPGFTLVELLVVVAIIGSLAAIAIPSFTSRQGKAYDARVRQDARNVATAEEAYFTDQLAYFTGDCILLPGVNVSAGVTCTATASGNMFEITTSHPKATVSCTWTSNAAPNLDCH